MSEALPVVFGEAFGQAFREAFGEAFPEAFGEAFGEGWPKRCHRRHAENVASMLPAAMAEPPAIDLR